MIEYTANIILAYLTGNILGFLIFDVLPKAMAQGGKPNAIAPAFSSELFNRLALR